MGRRVLQKAPPEALVAAAEALVPCRLGTALGAVADQGIPQLRLALICVRAVLRDSRQAVAAVAACHT